MHKYLHRWISIVLHTVVRCADINILHLSSTIHSHDYNGTASLQCRDGRQSFPGGIHTYNVTCDVTSDTDATPVWRGLDAVPVCQGDLNLSTRQTIQLIVKICAHQDDC